MMKLWMKNAGVMVVAMGLMACGDDDGYAPVSTDLNLPLSVKSVDLADGDTDETSVIAIRESKGLSLNRGTYQVTAGPIVDLGRQLFILEMVEGLNHCAGEIRPSADFGDELEIEVPSGVKNIRQLLDFLYDRWPLLKDWSGKMLTAADLHYVDDEHILEDGQEIAIMPPVQGG